MIPLQMAEGELDSIGFLVTKEIKTLELEMMRLQGYGRVEEAAKLGGYLQMLTTLLNKLQASKRLTQPTAEELMQHGKPS